MTTDTDLLSRVRIASPCAVSWDSMAGDYRTRVCSECRLHVYNLSDMSAADAAALVRKTEGRRCTIYFRRADGTMLTSDCPKRLRGVRWRLARLVGAVVAAVAGAVTVVEVRPDEDERRSDFPWWFM